MIRTFVSLKNVISKVYRDNGTNDELPFADCVEWISEALAFIGAFSQFEVKSAKLTVANNKASLPCDFINLIDISHNQLPMYYKGKSLLTNYFCTDCKINMFDNGWINDIYRNYFYFQGNNIVTSFSDGEICFTYTAIPTDEEGYPMVPDSVSYMRACSSYVTSMLDRREWRRGRISDKVYNESKQDWDWNCAQARGDANLPSLAELENLKNTIVRLIPQQSQYSNFFNNSPERKRLQ